MNKLFKNSKYIVSNVKKATVAKPAVEAAPEELTMAVFVTSLEAANLLKERMEEYDYVSETEDPTQHTIENADFKGRYVGGLYQIDFCFITDRSEFSKALSKCKNE